MLIDTHCHLDAYFNLREVVQDVRAANVRVIAVTNRPSSYIRLTQQLSDPLIRIAIGAHPLEVSDITAHEWQQFDDILGSTKYVGEIGLDFSQTGASSKAIQIKAFDRICQILSRRQRIVTVHSRQAASTVLKHLTDNQVGAVIFHWFTGSQSDLESIVAAGHFFSLNASMCRSKRGRDVIATLPIDRVLLETDGPFAHTSDRQSWPSDVRSTCVEVSRLRDISPNELERATALNFKRLASRVEETHNPA